MTNPWASQLQLINTLLAEKDRLIKEKDELVASKDKLWRELHWTIQERDEKIENLTIERDEAKAGIRERDREIERLRWDRDQKTTERHTRETMAYSCIAPRLASSRGQMDNDVGNGEDGDELDSLKESHLLADPDHKIKEMNGAEVGDDSSEAIQDGSQVQQAFHESATPLRRITASLMEDNSTQPSSFSQQFAFAPLIRMVESVYEFGEMDNVATAVTNSIHKTMAEMERRHLRSNRAPYPPGITTRCAWMWTTDHSCRWTTNCPREFGCLSCFNQRRACLMWLGNLRWMILPLPPEVRCEDASWEDADYYIYSGLEKAAALPNVWKGRGY